jgi:hypothetical protein
LGIRLALVASTLGDFANKRDRRAAILGSVWGLDYRRVTYRVLALVPPRKKDGRQRQNGVPGPKIRQSISLFSLYQEHRQYSKRKGTHPNSRISKLTQIATQLFSSGSRSRIAA